MVVLAAVMALMYAFWKAVTTCDVPACTRRLVDGVTVVAATGTVPAELVPKATHASWPPLLTIWYCTQPVKFGLFGTTRTGVLATLLTAIW